MNFFFTALLSFFLLGFGLEEAQSHPSLSQRLQELDTHLAEKVKKKKVVGCAVAVVSKGKIVFMKAYGVRKKGEKAPITKDTVFQVGSLSKPITATLLALLHKKEGFSLEMPLSTLYPHLSSPLEVRHILSHTTGYGKKGWDDRIESYLPREVLIQDLLQSSPKTPGKFYDYHNLAYSLVEELVAHHQGNSFQQVLKEKIFIPLGMSHTWIGDIHAGPSSLPKAWPHEEDSRQVLKPSSSYSVAYHQVASASAGVHSSLQDMARFLQLQLGAFPSFLTPKDQSLFQTPFIEAPDLYIRWKDIVKKPFKSYYGLGWRIVDINHKRVVFHGGYLKGFTSFMAFIPEEQLGIILLHNGDSSFVGRTSLKFLGIS